MGERRLERRRGDPPRTPWSRILLTAAAVGPALWIGGVPAEVVPAFVLVVALLCVRLCTRSSEPLQVPWIALGGVLAGATTLLQWAPLGLRPHLAPELDALITAALEGTNTEAWAGLGPTPGDAAVDLARIAGLTLLCIAAAQLSWRVTATCVAVAGTATALVGFAHEMVGGDAIYGIYHAKETILSGRPALMTSFVNANHQSGLLLLGMFCAGGLACDQHRLGLDTPDPSKVDRYADRFLAAMAAIAIQLPALLLSLSRGAMVSALVVAPFALWLGLRRRSKSRPRPHQGGRRGQRRRSKRMSPMRVVVAAALVGLLLLVARHGAWDELATLLDLTDPEAELDEKIRIVAEAPALIGLSPVLGIGRGAFVDLFGTIDSQPGPVLHVHLESMPLAAVVRWGPVGGGAIVAALGWWWVTAMRFEGRNGDGRARRIVLLGLLALGLQSLGDFSLDYLGVGAPAVALVGALSPPPRLRWQVRRAKPIAVVGSAVAIAIAMWWLPATWGHRERRNAAMLAGETEAVTLLRERPLDGRLHRLLAREAAGEGDWSKARKRAETATQLRPGSIDGWLLLSAAESRAGETALAERHARRALNLLRTVPDEELVAYLLTHYPEPGSMAAIAPDDPEAWARLVAALFRVSPDHADALAAARARSHPTEAAPLRIRARVALRKKNPALALHHARLWRDLAPGEAASHITVAQALRAWRPPRLPEARDALEHGLASDAIEDAAARGNIEEALVRVLIDIGDPPALERARAIAPTLLRRPAKRKVQQRRERLVAEIETR